MNKLSVYNQMWYDLWQDMESTLYATMDKQISSNPRRHPYWNNDPYYLHMMIRDMTYDELDNDR